MGLHTRYHATLKAKRLEVTFSLICLTRPGMFAVSLQYLPHSLDLLAHVERPGLPLRFILRSAELLPDCPDCPTCLDQHCRGLDLGASHEASGAGSPGVQHLASMQSCSALPGDLRL